jgi:hypothetical protein
MSFLALALRLCPKKVPHNSKMRRSYWIVGRLSTVGAPVNWCSAAEKAKLAMNDVKGVDGQFKNRYERGNRIGISERQFLSSGGFTFRNTANIHKS